MTLDLNFQDLKQIALHGRIVKERTSSPRAMMIRRGGLRRARGGALPEDTMDMRVHRNREASEAMVLTRPY